MLANVDLLPEFYADVAAATDLTIIVQDEPAQTGVRLPVSVLVAILRRSRASCVKLEEPPTGLKISRLLKIRPGTDIFDGLGGLYALDELRRGARGTMTGFAYPEVLAAVRRFTQAGEDQRARRVFDHYLPLIRMEAQPVVGLAVRKEVLRRRGAIASGWTRGLMPLPDSQTIQDIDEVIQRLGLVPAPISWTWRKMDPGLTGRCAIVCAATAGLGLASARALAAEGARVVILGRRGQLAAELAASLPEAIGVGVDLTAPDATDVVVDAAERAFGTVDIVVLNSGGPAPSIAAWIGPSEMQVALDLVLHPAIRLVQRTLDPMRSQGWGRVVAIGSSGVVQPIAGLATSNAARSALAAYLKTLAGEAAADGVTVNMVIPGRLATDRVASLDAKRAEAQAESVEVVRRRSESSIPHGRHGDPDELGRTVAFVASEAAS